MLDSQDALDCSHWPAGDYELKEAYRNDLGQTTEDWLNLTIHNRPAPEFTLVVNGNGNTTDTECLVTMQQSDDAVDFPLSKRFGVSKVPKSKVILEIHTTVRFYQQAYTWFLLR